MMKGCVLVLDNKPFIHLFKTPYECYLYDVNTNSILRIREEVFQHLFKEQKSLHKDGETVSEEILEEIDKLKMEGFLSSNRPREIIHPQNDYLEYLLENKLTKMTLQITQQCNFMCSYCPYASVSNTGQRKHSDKTMSFEIAKKAIDFLIEHSIDSDSLNLGFYGGEPLLEFELIKRCVEYAQRRAHGKELGFGMTTNGTLLTLDKIDYLAQNNFSIIISLDGPQKVHDKHRRFAANGSGTFDAIEKNILAIKDRYPEFFKKILYNVVLDPQDDLKCVNDFFVSYNVFKDANVKAVIYDDTYSEERVHRPWDFVTHQKYDLFKAMLNYLGRMDNTCIAPLAKENLDNLKIVANGMGKDLLLPEKMSHSGPCIPGVRRTFVDVDGNLFPCERVSEVSDVMKIGHIDTGFNIEKARNILNIGKLTEDKCRNCWALRQCTLCAKFADNIINLSPDLIQSHCNAVRLETERKLRNYVALKEIAANFRDQIVG